MDLTHYKASICQNTLISYDRHNTLLKLSLINPLFSIILRDLTLQLQLYELI